jgi:cell division protein FtsI/penicillin-binding protein 2
MKVIRLLVAGALAAVLLAVAPDLGTQGEALAKAQRKTSKAKASRAKASKKTSKTTKRSSKSAGSKRAAKGRGKASSRSKTAARGKKMTKRERLAAARRARAEAAARRRAELARLAAIRRADDSMRQAAATSIANDSLKFEDPVARAAAVEALGKRAGTVVIMDPNNGRVLSIVNQRMAVSSTVKPCSTIKPVVALAAMSEDLMPEGDAQYLRACNCEYDLDDALAYSNNEYFQKLGRQLGLEKITKYAKNFGFGEKTGINLPNESDGELPDEDDIKDGGLGRVASHGDGIRITPIQLAAFTAAVANGGSLYQPQVVARNQRFTPVLKRQLKLKPEHRRAILEGMTAAVNYGTAKKARDPYDQVAGKTGSCIEYGSWTGLFGSFSSVAHPNLVIVVVTRGSTARGARAADVAGQIYHRLSTRYGSIANRPRRVSDDEKAQTFSNE